MIDMYLFNTFTASSGLYLFTTHLKLVSFTHWIHTHDTIIAIVAVALVAVIAAVVWFVRRRQTRA